ncbi:amino-acid N-acetyltransferase [Endozoicomonas sp. (ex Bugula neritina AB1)]|nr:amino-acid N-acetyltransferase [Endozoicomonas sp. (ex Bugula neritina AB1)]
MNKNDNNTDYVKFFRQSSPYIHAHRGKTFVIMLSGETLAHHNLGNIINDIALMSSLGVRLVLVNGARPQIEERLLQRGITSSFHDGRRITDKQSLESVKDAVGNVRTLIESKLSIGLVNSPMHGARIRVVSGNFVTAKPIGVLDGIDFQHTGEVRRIDDQAIKQLLDNSYVVLIPCLGHSPSGEVFSIEVEEIATQVANAIEAEKLILYGKDEGIFDSDGKRISRILPRVADDLMPDLQGESKRLLQAAINVCNAGVERAQIISYEEDSSLLMELFTRDGAGTLISKDHYEEIRSATIEDLGGILALIRPFEEKGILRRRSRKELEREIKLFSVILLDGMIIGCAALHPLSTNKESHRYAELACVVVHPEYRQDQRGDHLLLHAEELAREKGIEGVFVMTTQTAHWFIERGFTEADLKQLPEEVKVKHNPQRQSKVFIKNL